MKYVGIYWTFFAPKIKKSIKKRFGNDLAEKSIENGKAEYRRLLFAVTEINIALFLLPLISVQRIKYIVLD